MLSLCKAIEEVRRLVCAGMPLEFALRQVADLYRVNEATLLAAIDSSFE